MTKKELKRMTRGDLLEMLIAQMEENESLRSRLEKAEKELENRHINIGKAGSIAEAALLLNGVFEAAEAAAAQYLDSVREYSSKFEKIDTQIELETEEKEKAQAQCEEEVAAALETELDEKDGIL